jgi:hypothetical protein
LRLTSRRVFLPRVWIGMALLKIGFWIMGTKAEAIE